MKNSKDNAPEARPDAPADALTVETKLKKWYPDIAELAISQLVQLHTEMVKASKSLTLIPQTSLKNAESVHIADSVLAGRLIFSKLVGEHTLFDFGQGNGFPGLVFAVLFPKKRVVILDRDKRKLEYCKNTASVLKLSNLSVEACGIEDMAAGSVQNLVMRGVSPLQRAMLIARKPVAGGGRLFHMKSDGWANELAAVPSQLFTYWSPSLLGQYKLPETTLEMAVVATEKVSD